MKSALLFMLLMMAGDAGIAEAASGTEAAVAIRTYNYAAVSTVQLAAARLEAGRIFERAGISLAWIDCRVPDRLDGAACTEPLLAGRDLMLRLVGRQPAPGARVVALGESMLDREQRSGVLMTIDVFPVAAVAAQAFTPVPTLLGRAIAHEIGHLLLGSASHPQSGLMRALWSRDELRGLKPAHWGFTGREAAQMRRAVQGHSRTAD